MIVKSNKSPKISRSIRTKKPVEGKARRYPKNLMKNATFSVAATNTMLTRSSSLDRP